MNDNIETNLLPHIKLRFNIAYPTLEECYIFGYECAIADVSESENPYPAGSKESNEWLEGWWTGFYGNKPLFNYADYSKKLANDNAANDQHYFDQKITNIFKNVIEITSVLAVSALLTYQLIDLVA